jgi:hypothetical protein
MSRDHVVRQTSVEVYKELIESGALSGMRGEVWAWLYRHGPATRNEVANGVHKVPNDTSTRLKELVDMGNVREVGEDRCRVTGNNVILYDVTRQKWVGEKPKKSGGKRKPIIQSITSCSECPLVSLNEDEDEVCGLDPEQSTAEFTTGRPRGCELGERDVLLRGA